jgi:nudix-type nucleoside diphosphatase (YffH/AdpP family)
MNEDKAREDIGARVRGQSLSVLSDNHYILRKADFEYRHRDGLWQAQRRESYDVGDGATVLPIDRKAGTVLLIRQFRWPVFETGYRQLLIETIAGKLDGDTPEDCVLREAMEEAGVAIQSPRLVFHTFMSPGAVKERIFMFMADYDAAMPRHESGGVRTEGEDIETLEISLDQGLAMIASGEIADAKTVMLLQYAALNR